MDVGVIGMGVMGLNLAKNFASRGHKVAVYNRTTATAEEGVKGAAAENVTLNLTRTVEEFVGSLKKPRVVLLMVQAGRAVDETLAAVLKCVEANDIVIDCGNEFWQETQRRIELCKPLGVRYLGMGVSGGEAGARLGPSLMAGGERAAYEAVAGLLSSVAAVDKSGAKCCAYLGEGGAGNFVKMVHNGIEYGDMALISEVYLVMRRGLGMDNAAIASVFEEWDRSPVASYLVQISATVLRTQTDCEAGTARDGAASEGGTAPGGAPAQRAYLVDLVKDVAGSKGTGRWTVEEALKLGVPVPTIAAALDSRNLSANAALRAGLAGAPAAVGAPPLSVTLEGLNRALYASRLCAYAQGLELLCAAAKAHHFNPPANFVQTVACCWKAGCIIRAELLETIAAVYTATPDLPNLLVAPELTKTLADSRATWADVVSQAITRGLPVPALAASLSYYDSCCWSPLPLNLIQAQRDYFGAHTFERTDAPGKYHADWTTGKCTRQ